MTSGAFGGIFCVLANYLYDKIETNTQELCGALI
jgi:hypothetical protein